MKRNKISMKSIADSFKSRSFRVGGYSVAAVAIVLAIAVAANLFAGALPSSLTQFDTTPTQLFSMSEQTKALVSGLESEVTIYWVVRDGYEDPTLETMLNRYKDFSDRITVQKKDPDVYPTFVQQYTESVTDNSLIVESGERCRYVDYYDIFVLDYTSYYYYGTEDWSFCGESELTSAIDYVISEALPKLYILTGHGESALSDTYTSAIEYENIEMEELSLLTQEDIPEDADCVLICAPQSDISGKEKTVLESYLFNGGNLILVTDPPQGEALTNLDSLMSRYGVSAQEGIVIEGDQNYYAWGTPYYLLPELNSHTITSPLIRENYYVLLPIAHGLTVTDTGSELISVSELLTTSDDAYSKLAGYSLSTYEKEDGDISGPFALAVSITETIDDGLYSDLIWISSAAILDDSTNQQVSGGNQDFFLNALSYLCEAEESSITIHAKSLSTEYLTIDSSSSSMLTILAVGIVPLAYLTTGIVIWFRRKRK